MCPPLKMRTMWKKTVVKSGEINNEEMVVDEVNEEWIESRKATKKKHQHSVKRQTSKETCSMCD